MATGGGGGKQPMKASTLLAVTITFNCNAFSAQTLMVAKTRAHGLLTNRTSTISFKFEFSKV